MLFCCTPVSLEMIITRSLKTSAKIKKGTTFLLFSKE